MVDYNETSFWYKRASLLRKLIQLFTVIIAFVGGYRFWQGDLAQASADGILSLILLIASKYMARSVEHYRFIIHIVYTATIAASIFALFHLHSPVRYVWFSSVVYITLFLFPLKESLRWFFLICLLLVGIGLFGLDRLGIDGFDFFIWTVNIVLAVAISKWYFDLEQLSMKRLKEAQVLLEEEVSNKTKALRQKTQELEVLNNELEERIMQKVQENQEQATMMFHQARYAQMGEMLQMIAHQWRQPLNAITLTSYTVRKKLQSDTIDKDSIENLLTRMDGYVQHLSQTIDDFRTLFTAEKTPKETQLRSIVADAIDLMKPILEHSGIEVAIHCPKDHITMFTYPNEVVHVLLNLMRNAQEAMLARGIKEGKISLRAKIDHDNVYIVVEDNAGGVDAAVRDHMFEPYVTTKTKDGNGLGLYMSRMLMRRQCQGDLTYEPILNGSRFVLWLPRNLSIENSTVS